MAVDFAPVSRLKVIWVVSPLVARGGGFDILRGWIRHLTADCYDLSLAYFSREPERVEAALAPWPHVRLIHVGALRSPALLYVPAIAALRRLFKAERPHIVHSVMVQGDILGSVAARLAGVPVVVSSGIGYLVAHTSAWKARLYRAGIGLARRRIDRVLAISGATRRELIEEFGYAPDQVQVLYSGVELDAGDAPRQGLRRDQPVVGTIGELIPEKGVQHLLRAAPAIVQAVPEVRFRVVGDGSYRPSLEALAGDMGVRDRVDFVGWVPEGRSAMAQLDVFVFPSDPGYDGLPRVLLEAWLVGTPFVTTNVAVVPEIVRHGEDGLVVPPKDPAAIAAGVVRLLRDAALWGRLSQAGRARAPEFGVEREVEVLRHVYAELLARAGATGAS